MSLFQRRFHDVHEVPHLRFPRVPYDHPDMTVLRIAYDFRGVAMAIDRELAYAGPEVYGHVTEASHPILWHGLNLIAMQMGSGRVEDDFRLPVGYEERCSEAEEALRDLDDASYSQFMMGDRVQADAVGARSHELGRALDLVRMFFDGFPEEGR